MTVRSIHTCKPGSAWDTWQKAGAAWRVDNPTADDAAAISAATDYAQIGGYPDLGKSARYRAFMECV
jgi:hypothetical protein